MPEGEERLLVVDCSDRWCGRSDALQEKLVEAGYLHVGIFAAGLPVETET